MEKLYKVEIPFSVLKDLDGKVPEDAQKIVDIAKREQGYGFEIPIMNEILRKAEEKGTFTWRNKQIRSCSHCDKSYDYHRYARNSRWHNKGDKNLDKPKYYRGIEFHPGFVNFVGHGDMCTECEAKHNIKNKIIDYIIDNDLKVEIQKNDYRTSKYLKDEIKTCFECEQEMAESEMGKESTVMGDGTYPSTCPHCGAKSLPFGKNHKTTNKYKHVENPAAREEIEAIRELVKEFNKTAERSDRLYLGQAKSDHKTFVILNEERPNTGTTLRINIDKKIFYLNNQKIEHFTDVLTGYERTDDRYFYMK